MVALDAAAVSDFAAVGITAVIGQVLSSPPGGVDSVDAATGSTEGDGNMRAKSGGGINSSVNKSVGVRGGKPTTNVISPRGVSEYGYATPGKLKAGAHTADNTSLNVFERKAAAAAQMGNAKALDVGKGGPGTGRTVLRSGGQGVHGPVAGPAPIQGRDI
jgi:hypothetical protein